MIVVADCDGCLKVKGGRCVAFKDPAYQHRRGRCYGYTDCPDELKRIVDQMVAYSWGVESYRNRLSESLRGVE